jgi:hypothetical protein
MFAEFTKTAQAVGSIPRLWNPQEINRPFWVYRMRKMKCMRVVIAPGSAKPQVVAQMVVALAA